MNKLQMSLDPLAGESCQSVSVMLITDIFGVGEATEQLTASMGSQATVHIIDPYSGLRNHFASEQTAYSAFIERCGHEDYYALAKAAFEQLEPDVVIGFSAGGNACWRLAADPKAQGKVFCCFYPTRIHQYLTAEPVAKTQVVFPEYEPGFDVTEVSDIISQLHCVEQQHMPYKHGFMNQASSAYDETGLQLGMGTILNIMDLSVFKVSFQND
ncbi:dienelactone hydrolase family protein [Shewanella halifaxensis]|uniref:dienelactone hydrolase family protein n=1 Tax=Shewanella halifaxensis TaxID=271098 RepID=UPI000D590990|nr:dienelactone hydrolase family protein [Shewanella halifaxensis]